MKELKDQNKYTSYEMVPVDDNIYICLVRFGVYSGDYADQEHVMEVKFAWGSGEVHHFPYDPPLMTFKTPILHPNIGEYPGGAICLDFLKQSGLWSPTCTVLGLVDMIRALLLDPN
ncbi:MAG: ubiquitin-conjugating enzyme E2 variant, partial [Culicoidibacterales bacterium]